MFDFGSNISEGSERRERSERMVTYTLTFCETVENHVGMEQIGEGVEHGFSVKDLQNVAKATGGKVHMLSSMVEGAEDAAILVIKGGVNILTGDKKSADKILGELLELKWDDKYYCVRTKKVKRKIARNNVNFADKSQAADFAAGKGTVVDFASVPEVAALRDRIQELVNINHKTPFRVLAEGNFYDNTHSGKKKDAKGIGWHGDTERCNVIGVRFGDAMCLKLAWFQWSKQVTDPFEFDFKHGDVYVLSEKAVGYDWRYTKGGIMTLRHCAGVGSFVEDKERGTIQSTRPKKVKQPQKAEKASNHDSDASNSDKD